VKIAMGFSCQIHVTNLSKGTDPVDAKSILGVLASCVNQDDRIQITAEGEDDEQALAALCDLIERNFDEVV
jgi:phosphotransferase system HPr (HPr) family protein